MTDDLLRRALHSAREQTRAKDVLAKWAFNARQEAAKERENWEEMVAAVRTLRKYGKA